jgi:hypothetical protein
MDARENHAESAHFMQSEVELTPPTPFMSPEQVNHDVVLKNLKFQHFQTQYNQPL